MTQGGPLGGALPGYNIYRTLDGRIVVAALESHFWDRLQHEVNLCQPTKDELGLVFVTRRSGDWEEWANAHDLPLVALPEALAGRSSSVLEEIAQCGSIDKESW